jgi:hypothetical protein
MMHPHTRLVPINEVVGEGVIATQRIPRGSLVWVMDGLDQAIPESEIAQLPACWAPLVDRWTFSDGRRHRVLLWDHGRYVNHSCAPNCGGTEFGFEIALRDIEAGEQLSNDYATLFMGPSEAFHCECGALRCRGDIDHRQVPEAVAAVRRALTQALDFIESAPQPLWPLLDPQRLQSARLSLTQSLADVLQSRGTRRRAISG